MSCSVCGKHVCVCVCVCEALCVSVVYVVVSQGCVCACHGNDSMCVGEDNESPVLRFPVSSTEKMTSCVALKQIAYSHDQKHGTVLTCPCELFVSCVPVYTFCVYSLCPVFLSVSVPIPVQGYMCVKVFVCLSALGLMYTLINWHSPVI